MIVADTKFIFTIEGVQTKVYHANKGEGLPKHNHEYAHATICYAGSIKVTKENGEWILNKYSQPVLLKAIEWHEIEALEDGTIFTNIFKT